MSSTNMTLMIVSLDHVFGILRIVCNMLHPQRRLRMKLKPSIISNLLDPIADEAFKDLFLLLSLHNLEN